MKRENIYLGIGLIIMMLALWLWLRPQQQDDARFTEMVKVALRDAGNQLLWANQDSTSLILPIKEIEPLKYQLSFQKPLAIQPDSLVNALDASLKKAQLPDEYLTEVLQCYDDEVAYSFDMKKSVDTDIIPCGGRDLPKNCYTITVRFMHGKMATSSSKAITSVLVLALGLVLIFYGWYKSRYLKLQPVVAVHDDHVSLGSFYFYPDQNKLVKQATEISLSKKECEILSLFVARPNQIIKRDELSKAVWEDHGVVVGRSLDTYISKLRKKLKADKSIKITNIHGVGYKLELE